MGDQGICKQLDDIVLEFFATLTELYQQQERLDASMKNGFLNLSRARYNMGMKCVGIEQCDETKMKASVKLSLSHDKLLSQYDALSDLESSLNDLDIDAGEQSGVRKRPSAKHQHDGQDSHVEDVEMDNIQKTNKRKLYDPITWFGVLVPPVLRQSQADFKKATEITVHVANLQTKIHSLQKQYKELQKKKSQLK